jgi:molybdate-binding protein/DNA-binding XRE family transcriptional regulator
MSQAALAAAAGLSRQSVGLIEAGKAMPAVDVALRLARVLGESVEDLFAPGESPLAARWAASVEKERRGRRGERLVLARIGGRWVAHPLGSEGARVGADALAAATRGRGVEAELVRPAEDVSANVIVMGCAPALGLMAERFGRRATTGRLVWLGRSSTCALRALARGEVHVAGVHFPAAPGGGASVADVRRIVGAAPISIVALARWEVGLVVARGNPRRVRGVADLARRRIRLAVRERGSGARELLDRRLRAAGVGADVVSSATVRATGHLEVAQAVALGAADVGVATRDAAIAFGLDLVPLAEERFDLVVGRAAIGACDVEHVLDLLTHGGLQRELSALGYDLSGCGHRMEVE